MANKQPLLAPDMQQLQDRIALRQQLAGQLMQRGTNADYSTQMAGGFAVQRSPYEALANIGSALLGAKMANDVSSDSRKLAQALQDKKEAAFYGMAGIPRPQQTQANSIGQTSANVTPEQPQPVAFDDAKNKLLQQAHAAYMEGNTDLANKLLENASTLTTEQKNMAAMGQDPRLMGNLQLQDLQNKATFTATPGTVSYRPNGSTIMVPNLEKGQIYDPTTGAITTAPGFASSSSDIVRAQKLAEKEAEARYDLVPFTDENGNSFMVTREQLLRKNGVTPVQQGAPQGQANLGEIQGSPFEQLRQLMKIPDQNDRALAVDAWHKKYGGGQPQATESGGFGLPTQGEGSKLYKLERTKHYAGLANAYSDSYREALGSKSNLDRLSTLVDSPNMAGGAGAPALSKLKSMAATLGVDIAGLPQEEAFKQITTEMFLKSKNQGGVNLLPGAMSEGDRQALEQMTVSLANSPEGRKLMLDRAQKLNDRAIAISKMAAKYEREHGQLDAGFEDMLDKFSSENPMFKDQKPVATTARPVVTSGLPNAAQYKNGTTATGDDGSKWLVVNGKWVRAK